MHLEGLSADAMGQIEIPYGLLLVYRLAPDLTIQGHDWGFCHPPVV
jgi:hypothetical protein